MLQALWSVEHVYVEMENIKMALIFARTVLELAQSVLALWQLNVPIVRLE